MLGSSSSVANPNIILNTAVAESLRQFYEKLKDVPADEMESAVHELLKQTIIDHKRVIFNGNGYTDDGWKKPKNVVFIIWYPHRMHCRTSSMKE